jgi:hypothetical protein
MGVTILLASDTNYVMEIISDGVSGVICYPTDIGDMQLIDVLRRLTCQSLSVNATILEVEKVTTRMFVPRSSNRGKIGQLQIWRLLKVGWGKYVLLHLRGADEMQRPTFVFEAMNEDCCYETEPLTPFTRPTEFVLSDPLGFRNTVGICTREVVNRREWVRYNDTHNPSPISKKMAVS